MAWWPAVGAIVGAVGSYIGNQKGANSANKFNQDAATLAYQRQRELDQWLGSNQIQWRANDLEAAGFNRVLAVNGGLGGVATQSAPQAASAQSVRYGSDAVGAATSSAQAVAQARQIQAQNALITAQADKTSAEAENVRADTANKPYEALRNVTSAGASEAAMNTAAEQVKQIATQVELLKEQIAGQRITNEWAPKLKDLESKMQALQIRLTALKVPEQVVKNTGWAAAEKAVETVKDNGKSWFDSATSWLNGVYDYLKQKSIEGHKRMNEGK
jgi:hypothetical protein